MNRPSFLNLQERLASSDPLGLQDSASLTSDSMDGFSVVSSSDCQTAVSASEMFVSDYKPITFDSKIAMTHYEVDKL